MATQTRPVPPPPELPAFKPYVPSAQQPAELTVRAVILGAVLGIVFAASSVYLALKIGLTVSASIPIAVLVVAFFRPWADPPSSRTTSSRPPARPVSPSRPGSFSRCPRHLLMGYDLSGRAR